MIFNSKPNCILLTARYFILINIGLWADKVLTDIEMKVNDDESIQDLKLVLYSAVSLLFIMSDV